MECIDKSMENMHTDSRVYWVNRPLGLLLIWHDNSQLKNLPAIDYQRKEVVFWRLSYGVNICFEFDSTYKF